MANALIKQYQYNVDKGPYYQPISSLPESPPSKPAVRLIAYYLPQFHAIDENDLWWGPGFTEWTNATKTLPRFVGHYQPRMPGDMGFYDLSNPDHIKRQVELANRAGIYGFCIHNYWFSGKRLLETPLRTILNNKDINIRFCLNWANENWSRRWEHSEGAVLMKQEYADGEDIAYLDYISEFIEDDRYIKVNGRPLIMLYRPALLPDPRSLVERWREHMIKRGYGNPYIVMPQTYRAGMPKQYRHDDPRECGMDAAAGFPPHKVGWYPGARNLRNWLKLLDDRYEGRVHSYDTMVSNSLKNKPKDFLLFPGVCPQWDNSARRVRGSVVLQGSTPEKYGEWLLAASRHALDAPSDDEKIVFINAWNEWAEGAYLEPDRHYGYAYLAETARVLRSLSDDEVGPYLPASFANCKPLPLAFRNVLRNFPAFAVREAIHRLKRTR